MSFNRQDAFNTMVTHLRKQGKRALKGTTHACMYRAEDGSKCAVGALIPDERYHTGLEGLPASRAEVLEAVYPNLSASDRCFLSDAQGTLHDNCEDSGGLFPEMLEAAVVVFANRYNLEVPA